MQRWQESATLGLLSPENFWRIIAARGGVPKGVEVSELINDIPQEEFNVRIEADAASEGSENTENEGSGEFEPIDQTQRN
ncbi:MAG: hypothetical protein HC910_21940 [Spirulinaceae cyanobacterium SM2_1_0]|nr:hypothetical protein [Spirulinaceae cyanobacterium SM2_1_0]